MVQNEILRIVVVDSSDIFTNHMEIQVVLVIY